MSPKYLPTTETGIFKHGKSGRFYIRETVSVDIDKSVYVERSLKTRAFDIAKERAKAIRIKLVRGDKMVEKKTRPTFGEAFDILEKIQSTKADETLAQLKSQLKHLRPWFKENCPYLSGPCIPDYLDGFETQFEEVWADYKLAQAAKDKVRAAEASRQGKKRHKPRKLGHDRRYLVMALKRAHKRGWVSREFTKSDFELNEVHEPVGKYIEDDEIKAILKACKPRPAIFLQVSLAVLVGMRISEILHLSKEEISIKKREIDLDPHRVKTRKRRQVPIPVPDEIFPLLKATYDAAQGPYLFPKWYTNFEGQPIDWNQPQDDNRYYWDKVRAETGIELRFHDLRHTAITNLLKGGMPDFAVRKFCGVSEDTMRRIYAHIESEVRDRFRVAMKGKFGEIYD